MWGRVKAYIDDVCNTRAPGSPMCWPHTNKPWQNIQRSHAMRVHPGSRAHRGVDAGPRRRQVGRRRRRQRRVRRVGRHPGRRRRGRRVRRRDVGSGLGVEVGVGVARWLCQDTGIGRQRGACLAVKAFGWAGAGVVGAGGQGVFVGGGGVRAQHASLQLPASLPVGAHTHTAPSMRPAARMIRNTTTTM